MTQPNDELAAADRALARRTRWITKPTRRLFNAPNLLVSAILTIWIGCSMLYALIEKKGPIESLWWGVVTGSTVGYGDFYPSTTAGRGVATFLILAMLILVPIAIGHVIANLVLDRNQFTHDEQVILAQALADIHERADRTHHLLIASLTQVHGAEFVAEALAEYEELDAMVVDAAEKMLEQVSREEG